MPGRARTRTGQKSSRLIGSPTDPGTKGELRLTPTRTQRTALDSEGPSIERIWVHGLTSRVGKACGLATR